MSLFYNIKTDSFSDEKLDRVEYSIQQKRKDGKEGFSTYSIEDITKHCKDDCYDEIVAKYDKMEIKTKVYEKDGKIYVKSEAILVIVVPVDQFFYGGNDIDSQLTVYDIIENNKEVIDAMTQKLKSANKKAYYDNYDKIKKYMTTYAKYQNRSLTNGKFELKRLMKTKLISYMKHPSIQMYLSFYILGKYMKKNCREKQPV